MSGAQAICNNPLNHSKSKSLYSFPKASRFPPNKPIYSDAFYDLPSTINQRKAGFGIGQKYDFTRGIYQTPDPTKYQIKTNFEKCIQKKVGFTFGDCREKMPGNGIFNTSTLFVPGPGNYPNKSTLSGSQFTMKQKFKNPIENIEKVPGPGHYPFYKTLNKVGVYGVSKYQSSKASNFNPPRSVRFSSKQFVKDVPGPGTYDMECNKLSKDGSYFISNYQNSRVRSFSHTDKNYVQGSIYENTKEASQNIIQRQGSWSWKLQAFQ